MTCIPQSVTTLLILFATAAEPSTALRVELTTLSGQRHDGALIEVSSDHVSLKNAKGEVRVPLAEVLDIRSAAAKPSTAADPRGPELTLTDGARLYWSGLRINDRRASIETPRHGNLAIAVTSIGSVRFAPLDPQVADAWKELSGRQLTQDMLVIRKNNVLDHLDGTVGNVDDSKIRFVLDGEEHPVNRERIFGIVYARRNTEAGKPVCQLATVGGDLLKAQKIEWSSGQFKVGLLGGVTIVVRGDQILSLDFSAGKVQYLSQLEPREVKYTPFFDQVWTYCRDHPRDGGALRLGNKEYARGLWIHSRTLLKYRINGEYRRFQAVMGIDRAVAPLGNVHVVISGDGKTLHESDVRGSDPPQNLDLDVAGIRDLEILVDFGADLDIADHLDLGDAKVIK